MAIAIDADVSIAMTMMIARGEIYAVFMLYFFLAYAAQLDKPCPRRSSPDIFEVSVAA